MVELRLNQRLGNTMFQYSVARILADELQCGLVTTSQTHPSVELSRHFANAPLAICRPDYCGEHSPIVLRQRKKILKLDLASIIAQRPQRILVDGHFESFKHLAPYQDKLRGVFFRPLLPPVGHLAIHLRSGDVAGSTAQVPEYIDYAILVARQNPGLPIDFVVETLDDPFAQESFNRLQREAGNHVEILWHPEVIDSFDYLRRCQVIVATNSTWTWWCGFLTPQAKVHIGISKRQPQPLRNRALFRAKVPANFSVFDLDRRQDIEVERVAP